MEKVVDVINLGKRYTRKKDVNRTLKSFVLGSLGRNKKNDVDFWALRNVNFEVNKSETLGIIGANGAGKSTLLSLIARTTAATEGEVKVRGRMSTLLELGAGFHPDLTGRENVFLNASILGMSREETKEKYDEIVTLSGIKDAIDSPVKYFSSGMYVRLGFAVAVMSNPDIMLMDEILAVGDESFRKKSLQRIESLKAEGKTMLIVSHDLETIKKMADRVLLLNEGNVVDIGQPLAVVDHYRNFGIYQDGDVFVKEFGTRDIVIEDVAFKSGGKIIESEINEGAPLEIEFVLNSKNVINNPVIGFGIVDNIGNIIYGTNTQILNKNINLVNNDQKMMIQIPSLNLQRGSYYVSLAVHNEDHSVQYHRLENAFKLKVKNKNLSEGILHLPCDIVNISS